MHSNKKTLSVIIIFISIIILMLIPSIPSYAAPKTEWNIILTKAGKKETRSSVKGDTVQLNVSIGINKIKSKDLEYNTSNKSVATVSNKGVISAKATGKAKITVKKKGTKEKCVITLSIVNDPIKIKDIEIKTKKTDINVGTSTQLTAKIKPTDATNKEVKWTTSNNRVLKVTSTGMITGLKEGKAIITAKAKDGTKIYDSCTFYVHPIPVTAITLSENNIRILPGNKHQLTARILPKKATNKKTNWTTNNKAVATVDQSGLVKGVGSGSAIITATTVDGKKKAVCVVYVPKYIDESGKCGSNLNYTIKGYEGDLILTITGTGEMYSNVNVGWESYNKEIKKVILPDGLTSIKDSAFYEFTELKDITIPNTVLSIGESAFNNCSSLEKITLPSMITVIPDKAFYQCAVLKNVSVLGNITKIGANAFCESGITKFNIPESCTEIGWNAFSNSGLEDFTIPSTVTNLGKGICSYCPDLESVTIYRDMPNYQGTFFMCKSIRTVIITEGVTSFNEYFVSNLYGTTTIESIYIPHSLMNMEIAFDGRALDNIYYNGTPEDLYKIDGYKWLTTGEGKRIIHFND